jgi:(p)ppGpp synthase/HD superfamily hydrolase
MEVIERAFSLMLDLHAHQTRKFGEVPVISHLMEVSSLTLEMGGTIEAAAAALLHDAIEDTPAERARQLIGDLDAGRVLALVEQVTETDMEPKPPWTERKLIYIAHMAESEVDALIIALADKLHNARTQLRQLRQQPDMWERFNAGEAQQAWWYRSLIDAFRLRLPHVNQPHLAAYVDELEEIIDQLFGPGNRGKAPDGVPAG